MNLAQFGPKVVVLGGGISRSPHLFLPAAIKELEGLSMQLRVSRLLDNAPLAGAAVAWFNGSNGAHAPFPCAAADVLHADAI